MQASLSFCGMYLNKAYAYPTPLLPHGYQFIDGAYPSIQARNIYYARLQNHTSPVGRVTQGGVVRLNCPIVTDQPQNSFRLILLSYGRQRTSGDVEKRTRTPPTEINTPNIQGNYHQMYLRQYLLLCQLNFNPYTS